MSAKPPRNDPRHDERILSVLADRIAALSATVEHESRTLLDRWSTRISDPAFEPAAANLAAYLSIRRMDLRALQRDLTRRGLSSLGRSEGHVLATLHAVAASLGRMAGRDEVVYPSEEAWTRGDSRLAELKASLFGAAGPQPGVMVTLPGSAAGDRALVTRLLRSGMTCARINCAHDGPEAWSAMIALVREESSTLNLPCRVMMDLPGPKCRVEAVWPDKPKRLHVGDCFRMLKSPSPVAEPDMPAITTSFPAVLEKLRPGLSVWINDGRIRCRIVEPCPDGWVLEVTGAREKGERLKPEKGIGLPGQDLGLPALSEADLEDLAFIVRHADLVGYSFVQRPEDVALLDSHIARLAPEGTPLPLVLKVETAEAVRNVPRLIVQAAGRRPCAIMIARGDLAVDLGFARLAEVQEEILWLCQAASVPVVWATQVLDDLVRDGLPSRSEATDAAMAQRAECVMLNKGPFLPEAVEFLSDMFARMSRHQSKKVAQYAPLQSWPLEAMGFDDG
jgi:pyruvate kinase